MPQNQSNPPTSFRMIAKTLYGLEPVLAGELKDLGAGNIHEMVRSVEYTGNQETLYKSNLWCRTATRILLPIKTFRASHKDELYRHIKSIDWGSYMKADSTLAIDAVVSHSPAFDNSMYVAQRAKDAIVDQFRERTGKRPSVDINNPALRLNLHIHQNQATLSLDSSGESLSRRGYRLEGGIAPLNEILAAGIIYLSEWDKQSSFIDGMCGSGTFVIEAALMARNIAPGILRSNYGFKNWKDYNRELFEKLLKDAREKIISELPFEIVGSDISQDVIREAKTNARRAKVTGDIKLECLAFDKQTPPSDGGVIILNPPYGERMSLDDLESFYKMIGDTFKQMYEGYRAYVFTGNLQAAKALGLRTSQKIKLYNGPLECRLMRYDIYSGSKKKKYRDED